MSEDGFDPVAFGKAVAERRQALGLTLYEVAKRAGVGDAYYRRVEAGATQRIGVGVLLRLARALDVPPERLLGLGASWTGGEVEQELRREIERLDGSERQVLLGFARGLLHLRRLKARRVGEELVGPVAAYDREVPREEDWPVDVP